MAAYFANEGLSGEDTDEEEMVNNVALYRHVEEYDGSYELVISDFSIKRKEAKANSTNNRLLSDEFVIGDYKWRLIYFPLGNNVNFLSLYIDAVDTGLPANWRRHTKFRLTVKNHNDPKASHSSEATHIFCAREHDWGFTRFISFAELLSPDSGFWNKNDSITIIIETKVSKEYSGVGMGSSYLFSNSNSRKETGYIGIKNQGATCYMNSLLQSLYHLSFFRRAVYHIPTEPNVLSIPYALQSLFYRLQTSNEPVSTKELTKSFGWDDYESFHQHDATEFNRVLIDTLETKMKGTPVEGTMEKLFRGEFENYIECINVSYKSTRPEFFYDLQLTVEGCKTVYDSFRSYVKPEILSGANQYQAEGFGLQDASRGIRFKTFPDILELNLMRFKHDYYTETIKKINDRFEFYPVIDLKEFLNPNESGVSTVYHLHAVLVHSGTMHGGHYYAYIRPTLGPEWFRFDDETVRKATEKEAIDENFGHTEDPKTLYGYTNPLYGRKFANAYMLIYVRDSRVREIFEQAKDEEIPRHLVERIENEQILAKKRAQERAEAHLYMTISLVTEKDLQDHNQELLDLVDFNKIAKNRVKKATTLGEFRVEQANKMSVPPEKIRFWNWISRKNKTIRVQKTFSEADYSKTLDMLADKERDDLRLFLDLSPRTEPPYFDTSLSSDSKSGKIFFKFFDVPNQKLSYLGHTIFDRSQRIQEFVPLARTLLNLAEDQDLVFYEEVKPSRIDLLKFESSFAQAELVSGDIIVVEKAYTEEERNGFVVKNSSDFFDYLQNRVTVKFQSLTDPNVSFSLDLTKPMTYTAVTRHVAEKTQWDPHKIRFARNDKVPYNAYYSRISPAVDRILEKMLEYTSPRNTLYYELLDVTLEELESKKTMKIAWVKSNNTTQDVIQVLVNKNGTVRDITQELQKKVPLLTDTKEIRVFQLLSAYNGDSVRIFKSEHPVAHIYDAEHRPLYAEEIPPEELEDSDGLLHCVHYEMFHSRASAHSVPFFMVVQPKETIDDLKTRIRARLGTPEKEFNTWKFSLVTNDRPQYFTPGQIVDPNLSFDYFGLEHPSPKKYSGGYHHYQEKPITFKEINPNEQPK